MYLDCPPCAVSDRPATTRHHVLDLRPGDTILVDGEPRRVTDVAAALDGTRDLRMGDGGRVNMHRFRRVSVVG